MIHFATGRENRSIIAPVTTRLDMRVAGISYKRKNGRLRPRIDAPLLRISRGRHLSSTSLPHVSPLKRA